MVSTVASAHAIGRVGGRLRFDLAHLLLVYRKTALVTACRCAFDGRMTRKTYFSGLTGKCLFFRRSVTRWVCSISIVSVAAFNAS